MTEEVSTPRRGRRLAGVLAGVLALGIVPFAFPASSQTDAESDLRDITVNACPVDDQGNTDPEDDTTEVPEDGFTDVAEGADFEFEIDCVAWYDVTSGATATTYNPLGTVSRGQMATFIANLIDYVDENALDDASDTTTDAFPCPSDPDELVPTDTHYENIQRLADADIVRGGPAGQPATCYGPDLRVSRAQMATFIAVAQTFLGEEIPAPATTTSTTAAGATTTTVDATTTTTEAGATTTTTAAPGPVYNNFFDDDDDSVHENNINAIASEGIVIGTSDRTYRPQDDIRRQQMAAFLARKLDYLIENGATSKPDPVATTTTTTTVAPTMEVTAVPETLVAADGGDVELTITPSAGTVESASVTGCGIDTAEETLTDADTTADGFQADVVTIPPGAGGATATCDLTVDATLDDGSMVTDDVTITLT